MRLLVLIFAVEIKRNFFIQLCSQTVIVSSVPLLVDGLLMSPLLLVMVFDLVEDSCQCVKNTYRFEFMWLAKDGLIEYVMKSIAFKRNGLHTCSQSQ